MANKSEKKVPAVFFDQDDPVGVRIERLAGRRFPDDGVDSFHAASSFSIVGIVLPVFALRQDRREK